MVDKAHEVGDFKKAVELQEQNVRVFTILGISPEEARGGRRMLGEKQNTFIT